MSGLFEDDFVAEFDSDLFFAFLVKELSLTPKKMEFLENFYPKGWQQAVDDNFSKIPREKAKVFEKWFKISKPKIPTLLQELEKDLTENNIKILTYTKSEYPKNLFRLPDYPLVLFYQGNLKTLDKLEEMLTVVGSRLYTKYSEIIMNKILREACQKGVGVVSGLALGIDGISHKIALENQAPTVGVIGGGLDYNSFYPKQNWNLAQEILQKGGLIFSEYPPRTQPNKFTFPTRNRVLAALTSLTWVVQAGVKSGTLITANLARDLGCDVATTPASIFETSTEGNIKLLKEGVNIISETNDILHLLGLKTSENSPNFQTSIKIEDPIQAKIHENLSLKPLSLEEIIAKTNLPFFTINSALTMLELQGLVENLGENMWIRKI